MKLNMLLRKIHYWGSLIIMAQMGLIIGAGLLLMLKKEVAWIQPPTQKGIERLEVPALTINELFDRARAVPQLNVTSWEQLSRADIKPGKGVAKFVGENNWEVQIDTHSGDVLNVAFRRSDIIESLHDGSFFAGWVKLYIFFPSGIILLFLWGTGIYLFFLPRYKRMKKARNRKKTAYKHKI
jgi:uncharacterized iron-regulated membrane protein